MAESTNWIPFVWVPDGIYDNTEYLIRYEIKSGWPTTVISKIWLDKGGPADVEDHFKLPWGAYPDTPPKPQKK